MAMFCYFCPLYAIQYGILGLPGHICQGENFQRMQRDWGVIQYGMEAVDAEKRRDRIRETYEEVCRFMRYYHGLAKKTERNLE